MKDLQKMIIHNQALLVTVLKMLGMKDNEIEDLNKIIDERIEIKYEEILKKEDK